MNSLPPTPSLTIDFEKKLFIADKTFVEEINYSLLETLIQSEHLQTSFDESNYAQKRSKYFHENEKAQLKYYQKKYNKKEDGFLVTYCSAKHKLGRVYPKDSLGLTSFRKKIRNTLLNDKYFDIDIANCQPSILLNICKKNNFSYKT